MLSDLRPDFQRALKTTLIGMGTGIDTCARRYAGVSIDWWLESWWVKVVLELGIPGLLVVLALFSTLLGKALKNHFHIQDGEIKAISAGLLGFQIWILLYLIKGQRIDFDPVNVYFWILWGILAKLPVLQAKEVRAE